MKILLTILTILIVAAGCGDKTDEKEVQTKNNIDSVQSYVHLLPNVKFDNSSDHSEDNYCLDVTGEVFDENENMVSDCSIFIVITNDTTFYTVDDSSRFFIHLPLGHKYLLGFKMIGYLQKHLIIDVIKNGTPEDSKYGFEFPMMLKLIPGDVNLPSLNVARLEYVDSTGYIENVLISKN